MPSDFIEEKYPWSILETKGSSFLQSVYESWEQLLSKKLKEEIYHDYIARHAGLFLCDGELRLIAISKLRLGSDHVIDFAVAKENYSRGLYWNLIEIETPHTPPFTKRGQPSARLTGAIQQVHDWKRWIIENRREAERLFPANGLRTERKPNFRYTIIIGTRDNSEIWLHKRNQLSDELRVEIRSFDFLTDLFKRRSYHDQAYIFSAEAEKLDESQMNELVNPFYEAYPDSVWRNLLREAKDKGSHFVSQTAEAILFHRQYNYDLLLKFRQFLNSL